MPLFSSPSSVHWLSACLGIGRYRVRSPAGAFIFVFSDFLFSETCANGSAEKHYPLPPVPPLLLVSLLPQSAGALFAAGALLAEAGLCDMGVPPTQSGRNYGKGEPTRDEGSFRSKTVKHNLAITGEEIELSHFPCGKILQTPCFIN